MDRSEVKNLQKVDHTPAELDEASKILLRAAALIEEKGWCTGVFASAGRMCARGAIYRAATGSPYPDYDCKAGVEAESRIAASVGGQHPCDVGGWNNARGRTKDEVVAKLRAVALGL